MNKIVRQLMNNRQPAARLDEVKIAEGRMNLITGLADGGHDAKDCQTGEGLIQYS